MSFIYRPHMYNTKEIVYRKFSQAKLTCYKSYQRKIPQCLFTEPRYTTERMKYVLLYLTPRHIHSINHIRTHIEIIIISKTTSLNTPTTYSLTRTNLTHCPPEPFYRISRDTPNNCSRHCE